MLNGVSNPSPQALQSEISRLENQINEMQGAEVDFQKIQAARNQQQTLRSRLRRAMNTPRIAPPGSGAQAYREQQYELRKMPATMHRDVDHAISDFERRKASALENGRIACDRATQKQFDDELGSFERPGLKGRY